MSKPSRKRRAKGPQMPPKIVPRRTPAAAAVRQVVRRDAAQAQAKTPPKIHDVGDLTPDFAPARILGRGVNVQPLLEQIEANPDLWDQNRFRTIGGYGNPHAKLSDIVVRFNDWKNWTGDRARFNDEHDSVWWAAYERLPYIQPLVFDLARIFFAERIGMVLITKIPPQTTCEPHVDAGWHANHYLKFALQLKSAPGQAFCYEGFRLETRPGDLYAFDNSKPHWVENPTDQERWTLIICLRLKQPTCFECVWSGE